MGRHYPKSLVALNAICPYYTMFPLDMPLRQLEKAAKDEIVLDPFCGRGSTNFAARLLGLRSVGLDSNPVAVAITEAKLVDVTPSEVVDECFAILRDAPPPVDVPASDFWSLCYAPETLNELCQVREELLRDCSTQTRKALRALLLGSLHGPLQKGRPSYLSNQMPRTFASKPVSAVRFWKKRELYPKRVDFIGLVSRKSQHYFDHLPVQTPATVIQTDSRVVDLTSVASGVTRVVTSPPYYGMRTYLPDQWLRLWFLGGAGKVVYTNPEQIRHSSPETFTEQLTAVWRNVARVCTPGARMTVRFGGIHDRRANPQDLLKRSFAGGDTGWKVVTARSAGIPPRSRRQAMQFKRALRRPIEEFDFHLRLKKQV